MVSVWVAGQRQRQQKNGRMRGGQGRLGAAPFSAKAALAGVVSTLGLLTWFEATDVNAAYDQLTMISAREQAQGSIARLPLDAVMQMTQAGKTGDAMVPPVSRERPVTPPESVETPAAAPAPAPREAKDKDAKDKSAPSEKQTVDGGEGAGWSLPDMNAIMVPLTDWLARANREYQGKIVKELSLPSSDADAEAKRLADQKAAEDAARAGAAKELAAKEQASKELAAKEEAARASAAKNAAQEAEANTADAEKKAEEKRAEEKKEEARRNEDARKAAEARKQQDEAEARRLREAARTAEEKQRERQRQEAARQQAEAEQRAAEARAAEEKRSTEAREKRTATAPAPEVERAGRQAVAQGTQRHRRWAITIIPEPIARPRPEPIAGRPELKPPVAWDGGAVRVASRRLDQRMRLGGPMVKGWRYRETACRASGRKVRLPGRYTVARGDSLWRISQKHYDNGRRYPRIWRANRHKIADPDLIYPCQRFKVPR